MKLKRLVFYFFVLFLTTGAVSRDAMPGEGLSEGSTPPDFSVMSSDFTQSQLSDYKGKYVLLQFWTSNDAKSRISNVSMSNVIETMPESSVKMISLALDESSEVARITAELDGIKPTNTFTISNVVKSEVKRKFRMNSGRLENYLLNESGIVVARNLTTDDLRNIVLN